MSHVVLTGGASGLGACIYKVMRDEHLVSVFDMPFHDVRAPRIDHFEDAPVDVLINCAGVNYIDWIEDFEESKWDHIMDVNAKGIFMMTKALLPKLKKSRGTILNIISDASHKPMSCSSAYNASKGAAHILTLQLARELRRHDITVFGVSPGRLAGTAMSKKVDEEVLRVRGWTTEEARSHLLERFPEGDIPPILVADFIAYLLQNKERHRFLNGTIIPYGGG